MLFAALTLALAAAPDAGRIPDAGRAPAPKWSEVKDGLGFIGFSGDYPFAETFIELPKGKVRLLISRGRCGVTHAQLLAWVTQAAQQVSQYFGRFPVALATVTVLTGDSGEIGGGTAFMGQAVRIMVGTDATQASLDDDWRMPHELLHLAFPDVDEDYKYLEEGLSTYLEPVIRAQTGQISLEEAWGGMVGGFPNGQPTREDKGLDHTHSWGNTYWGGARFWLTVDLEIRIRSKGEKSLQDALRGILTAGGDGSEHWKLERILEVAKQSTGTDALRDLHEKMGTRRSPFDLNGLWKNLGVSMVGQAVSFDDTAPLAAHRKAIMKPQNRDSTVTRRAEDQR